MKKLTAPLGLTALLLAMLSPSPGLVAAPPSPAALAKQAEGQAPVITSEGFDERIAKTTLYMEIPIEGFVGEDVTKDSVYSAMKIAADDKNIRHVVFMIDVEQDGSFKPREGSIIDKDALGSFNKKLEVHALVRTGLNFAIFPIFFSDEIYITEDGVIGGMPVHLMLPPGSDEVMAKLVGIYTNQLASAAENHGHNPDIVRAMIDQTKNLYYWRENGEVVVSNERPANPSSVESFEQIPSVTFGSTLTLDQASAIRVNLASPIEDFDAYAIGEQIGKDSWERANHYGVLANKIARILAEMVPQQEYVDQIDKDIPDVRITRENRNDPEIKEIAEVKQALEQASDGLDLINSSLKELLEVHPERHAYFAGPNGETILADPQQWRADVDKSKELIRKARSGMTQLRSALMKVNADPDHFIEAGDWIDKVNEHIEGIEKYGNVGYWEEHYVPELPPDIYG